jgi:hypothetical protein
MIIIELAPGLKKSKQPRDKKTEVVVISRLNIN